MGSGFGPSVTLRAENLLGRSIDVEIPLVYTYNRYELYRFKASIPFAAEKDSIERLTFDFDSGYASRARDGFYGIGNQTPRGEQRLQYRSVTRDASAGFTAKFNDTWSAGLHAMYRNVGITAPRDGRSAFPQTGPIKRRRQHFCAGISGVRQVIF